MAWWEYVIILTVGLLCTRAITQAIGGVKEEVASLRETLLRDMTKREEALTRELQDLKDQIDELERSVSRAVRQALSAG